MIRDKYFFILTKKGFKGVNSVPHVAKFVRRKLPVPTEKLNLFK